MANFKDEERRNMIDFIKREFGNNVKEHEMRTDDQIEKLYKEAYSHSEWGL